MCFTVNVNLVKEELENRYGANFLDPESYRPSYYYHAFGFPRLPVIRQGESRVIDVLTWGLIPGWVRSIDEADEIRKKTFNARSETLVSKPAFSASFESRRCIIPVSGFFEWQHVAGNKIPWYISRSDKDIMSLAGLWSTWTDSASGKVFTTFSVVTTDANNLMAEIHNSKKRMPLVIERDLENVWLGSAPGHDLPASILAPYPDEVLTAYTISDLVNNKHADKNTPEIIRPYSRPIQTTLF
ncbi:MAG: SOS response-associated peptidase [Bacteroidales bacterium]